MDEKRLEKDDSGAKDVVSDSVSPIEGALNKKEVPSTDYEKGIPQEPESVVITDNSAEASVKAIKKKKSSTKACRRRNENAAAVSELLQPSQNVASVAPTNPEERTRPGAIAVRGIDATDGDEEDSHDIHPEASHDMHQESSMPEARRLSGDQDPRRQFVDQLTRAESHREKERGLWGWIKRHKVWTAVIVMVIIGAVLGGALGATLSGPSPTTTPAPTLAPTITGFNLVADIVSEITPIEVLLDPSTPQNAAANWLFVDDDYELDFDDTKQVLQRYALATIYFATSGANWTNQLEFLSSQDECAWNGERDGNVAGVSCNDQGLVDSLDLSQNGLDGTLPNELVGLEQLTVLSAAQGNVTGTFPSTITKLTLLEDVRLLGNQLKGSFPSDFGDLSNLVYLDLSTNVLTGPLPSSLGQLQRLQTMDLSYNQLSGSVPSELSAMTSLTTLLLNDNDFVDGMETFCTDSIDLAMFGSDCMSGKVGPAELQCSCCTMCCHDNFFAGCIFPESL